MISDHKRSDGGKCPSSMHSLKWATIFYIPIIIVAREGGGDFFHQLRKTSRIAILANLRQLLIMIRAANGGKLSEVLKETTQSKNYNLSLI